MYPADEVCMEGLRLVILYFAFAKEGLKRSAFPSFLPSSEAPLKTGVMAQNFLSDTACQIVPASIYFLRYMYAVQLWFALLLLLNLRRP
jgi:hypothetical protein